jgi:hypothetical protein
MQARLGHRLQLAGNGKEIGHTGMTKPDSPNVERVLESPANSVDTGPMKSPRSRSLYTLWIALTIGSGLLLRSRSVSLPESVEKYGGDLLWALMVFFGFAWVFHRASTLRIGVLTLGFSWGIEFSQLYHAEWIDRTRAMRIGHLILGSTFNPPDLLAYTAGVALGIGFECLCRQRRPESR